MQSDSVFEAIQNKLSKMPANEGHGVFAFRISSGAHTNVYSKLEI